MWLPVELVPFRQTDCTKQICYQDKNANLIHDVNLSSYFSSEASSQRNLKIYSLFQIQIFMDLIVDRLRHYRENRIWLREILNVILFKFIWI